MAAGDLTTVAAVKLFGGVAAPTAADAQIGTIITALSLFVTNYTGRKFQSSTYAEIRDGTGGIEIMLSNQPLISLQTLTIATVSIPQQPADGQPGYFITPIASIASMVSLYGYIFSRGKRNVRIGYTAGYAVVPLDIAQAVNEAAVTAYRRGVRGSDVMTHTSTITHETTTYDLSIFPKASREIFDYYRKTVPV